MAVLKANGSILKANGKILVKPDSVVIGDRAYPVVKIGNQLWMAENLNFKANGIRIGSVFQEYNNVHPIACYYKNDESSYGHLGLYYNFPSLSVISTYCHSGWRVPTRADIEELFSFVNSNCISLKSITWNGTNETGFNALACGYNDDDRPPAGFGGYGDGFWFWSATSYSYNRAYRGKLFTDNSVNIVDAYFFDKFPIRLVKDV